MVKIIKRVLPSQTVSKLFGTLFVILDALLVVDFLSSSFDIVFCLLSEPLGVDFELPYRPSDFQKPSSRHHKINIFEGRKVSLGAQNRPQEAPKGDKKRYRKKKIENQRKEDHQERQKELQKALTVFGPATPGLRVKGEESSLVARGP